MRSTGPGTRAETSALVFILGTVFINSLGYGMITLLIPLYVRELGGNAADAGAFNSLYALAQFGSMPVLGALSDRFGRKPVLLTCLLGTAVAFTLLGLADALIWIGVAIALDGITGGNLPTAYAYVADITPPSDRARGMGLIGAALGLGYMIGPALGGLLGQSSLRLPAMVAVALALTNLVFGRMALPESLRVEDRTRAIRWSQLNPVAQFAAVARNPGFARLLLALFLLHLAFSGLQTNFPLFAQARFGWDTLRMGGLFAVAGICAVLVQGVIFPAAQRRAGEGKLMVIGLFIMAISLAGVAAAPIDALLFPIVGLAAAGSGLAIPALNALLSRGADPGSQGKVMGGAQALQSLALIAGPALAGIAFDRIGPGAPYWAGGMIALAACLIAGLAMRARTGQLRVLDRRL